PHNLPDLEDACARMMACRKRIVGKKSTQTVELLAYPDRREAQSPSWPRPVDDPIGDHVVERASNRDSADLELAHDVALGGELILRTETCAPGLLQRLS